MPSSSLGFAARRQGHVATEDAIRTRQGAWATESEEETAWFLERQAKLVAMLAVFSVLLVLNLVKGEPEANAEPQAEGGTGACCVDGECFNAVAADCAAFGGTFFAGMNCSMPAVSLNCLPLPTVKWGTVTDCWRLTK